MSGKVVKTTRAGAVLSMAVLMSEYLCARVCISVRVHARVYVITRECVSVRATFTNCGGGTPTSNLRLEHDGPDEALEQGHGIPWLGQLQSLSLLRLL